MPARCGVQKKSRIIALSGGGHDRLCPLAGKSADLPGRRRAGKFARFVLADVQMCKCTGMQISRRRGTRGMLLYIRIHAHAHASTSQGIKDQNDLVNVYTRTRTRARPAF